MNMIKDIAFVFLWTLLTVSLSICCILIGLEISLLIHIVNV